MSLWKSTSDFTEIEKTKLAGIETGANADQTNAEILTAVETASGRDMSADGEVIDTARNDMTAMGYQELYGLAPTLDLKFYDWQQYENGYPDFATFTRATIATRVNSLGLIEEVPSGELRHEYDPVTGAYKGVLIEE